MTLLVSVVLSLVALTDAARVKNAIDTEMTLNLTDLTGDTLGCVSANCPMDPVSMRPSVICLIRHCAWKLAGCLVHSACRNALLCENKCSAPLAGQKEAYHFTNVTGCIKEKCPGFPPDKACTVLHCGLKAAECAFHSACRHALECAGTCAPAATASLLDLDQEASHESGADGKELTLATSWVLEVEQRLQEDAEEAERREAVNSTAAGLTADALSCVSTHCPMDPVSMRPSVFCLIRHCGFTLSKCLIHSACRSALLCENRCTAPLAGQQEAYHFTNVTGCIKDECPGFPPSPVCTGLHCGVKAAECAFHTACRHALECAGQCAPAAADSLLELGHPAPDDASAAGDLDVSTSWVLEAEQALLKEALPQR